MNLQQEISAEVRGEFLQIVAADRLDPKATGRLMEIVDRHAFALYGFRHNYEKQLETGIFQSLMKIPLIALIPAAADRVACLVDHELRPAYLTSVRTTIELEKGTIPPDQWLPIQAFLDRRFPLVQDGMERHE